MNWAVGRLPEDPVVMTPPVVEDPAEEPGVAVTVVVAVEDVGTAVTAVSPPGDPGPTTPIAYRFLCRLLSMGRGEAEAGIPIVVSRGMRVVSEGGVVLTLRGVIDKGVAMFRVVPAIQLPMP